MRATANAVVVGGGIIGLSVALELAARGAEVTVLDTGEPARAASWAAAGMLAPRSESLADRAMAALCERSLELYPSFAAKVAAGSGIDPHAHLDGIVHAAFDEAEYAALQGRARALSGEGVDAQILARDEVVRAEPVLGARVRGGLLIRGEGHVDNRRLGRALIAACANAGVRVESHAENVRVEFDNRRVLGVHTSNGYRAAQTVVNAAGAWASQVSGVPAQCVPPVRPVKGQMFALALPAGMMHRPVWVRGAYLVPRADGRVLVGATVEESGDARVTAGGIDALLHAATACAPALREFTITEMWAGLRPATPDARPVLGCTARQGYVLACGHFRNGILLAPVTAQIVADAVESNRAVDAAFRLDRFQAGASVA